MTEHKELTAKFRLAFSEAVKGRGKLSTNPQASTTKDGRFMRGGLGKGSPDLIGVVQNRAGYGLSLAVEIKSAGDTLRPDQVDWLKSQQRVGAIALVVNPETCDDVVNWLQSVAFEDVPIFNPKPAKAGVKLSIINQINSIHF